MEINLLNDHGVCITRIEIEDGDEENENFFDFAQQSVLKIMHDLKTLTPQQLARETKKLELMGLAELDGERIAHDEQ